MPFFGNQAVAAGIPKPSALEAAISNGRDTALYFLLPIVIGFLLCRITIYAWMRSTGRRPAGLSPSTLSLLLGMLSPVFPIGAIIFNAGSVHTLKAELSALLLLVFVTFPIIIVSAPILFVYLACVLRGTRIFPNYIFWIISAGVLVSEYSCIAQIAAS
jgi:hypothetical protein